jgi:hypothetical protein
VGIAATNAQTAEKKKRALLPIAENASPVEE